MLELIVQPAQEQSWSGLDFFLSEVTMSAAIKPFTSFEEQIDLLRDRGMNIPDDDFILRWLSSVGYYRLSGYWHTSRKIVGTTTQGTKTIPIRGDAFEAGTTFPDIAALYEFDRKLRTAIHDSIERVEVALRTSIAHELASEHPLALYDRSLFRLPSEKPGGIYHYDLLTKLTQRINRAARNGKGDDHIIHNVEKYGPQLPTWVVMDVLDFSDLSIIFGALKLDRQMHISSRLGFDISNLQLSRAQKDKLRDVHPLSPWLRQLTILRNKSAHHARVWNCTLSPAGTGVLRKISGLESLPVNQSERIFGCLTILGKLLEMTSPGSSWLSKVKQLLLDGISSVPAVTDQSIGAPTGWQSQGIWNV